MAPVWFFRLTVLLTVILAVSILAPYRLMAQSPRLAKDCILQAPPITEFGGLAAAISTRDWFGAAAATAAVLSVFTPILLSNIPFSITQTWTAHLVCAWMTVSVLVVMMLVLGVSFFVKPLRLPVEPDTLAGGLYYLCDSYTARDLVGISAPDERDRAKQIVGMRRRYRFGKTIGLSGATRVGVDFAD